MITLQRSDPMICSLIGNKRNIKQGDMLRPSQFAIRLSLGDRKVVFNSLTGQCIETRYWNWFEDGQEKEFNENDIEMKALVRCNYLVRSSIDESVRYEQLIKTARAMDRPRQGCTAYNILPTTACNARCTYCYEAGIPYETMTDDIVDQTIRYIHETRLEGAPIHIGWFGGEPLIGEKIIDKICEAMQDAGVTYASNMISNGSLMTEEMAKKAREDWHLRDIQITLDGREEVYCERKNYVNFKGSPYHTVLDAIHALAGQNITVSIRLNVDEDNADELMALVDELEEEFKSETGISAYSHSIFKDESEEVLQDPASDRDDGLLYEKMAKLNEKLYVFNRNRSKRMKSGKELPQKHYDRVARIKRYYCMVDSPDSGGVILPNGDICLCESIGSVPVVGSIFDGEPIQREAYIERGREKNEKCAACALLPICTDFMSCPNCSKNCVKEHMAVEKRKLRGLETEKRLPPITIDINDEIVHIIEPTPEFAERCTPLLTDDYRKADVTLTQDEAISKYHL